MAHSREVRLPFLERRASRSSASRCPPRFLYRDGVTKAVLRDAVRGVVPATVLDRRDKVGFETPQAAWLSEPDWVSRIGEVLLDPRRESARPGRPGRRRGRRGRGSLARRRRDLARAQPRALAPVHPGPTVAGEGRSAVTPPAPRRRLVLPPTVPVVRAGTAGSRWRATSARRATASRSSRATRSGRSRTTRSARVVRARDLKSARLLRAALGRGPLPTAGPGRRRRARRRPRLLTKVLVPDAYVVSWLPAATLAVRRLVARGDVDCVVTTGPPDSAHLAAAGARDHAGRPGSPISATAGCSSRCASPSLPALSADWTPRSSGASSSGADAVVAATAPIADDLRRGTASTPRR